MRVHHRRNKLPELLYNHALQLSLPHCQHTVNQLIQAYKVMKKDFCHRHYTQLSGDLTSSFASELAFSQQPDSTQDSKANDIDVFFSTCIV